MLSTFKSRGWLGEAMLTNPLHFFLFDFFFFLFLSLIPSKMGGKPSAELLETTWTGGFYDSGIFRRHHDGSPLSLLPSLTQTHLLEHPSFFSSIWKVIF